MGVSFGNLEVSFGELLGVSFRDLIMYLCLCVFVCVCGGGGEVGIRVSPSFM